MHVHFFCSPGGFFTCLKYFTFMQVCLVFPRSQVRTEYLQPLQQSEVLKGSSLHHTDLVVLQVTVETDTKTQGKRPTVVVIITSTTKLTSQKKKNQQTREK